MARHSACLLLARCHGDNMPWRPFARLPTRTPRITEGDDHVRVDLTAVPRSSLVGTPAAVCNHAFRRRRGNATQCNVLGGVASIAGGLSIPRHGLATCVARDRPEWKVERSQGSEASGVPSLPPSKAQHGSRRPGLVCSWSLFLFSVSYARQKRILSQRAVGRPRVLPMTDDRNQCVVGRNITLPGIEVVHS